MVEMSPVGIGNVTADGKMGVYCGGGGGCGVGPVVAVVFCWFCLVALRVLMVTPFWVFAPCVGFVTGV